MKICIVSFYDKNNQLYSREVDLDSDTRCASVKEHQCWLEKEHKEKHYCAHDPSPDTIGCTTVFSWWS